MSTGTKQVMHKYCVIVVAILGSIEILVSDGRQIKPVNLQNQFDSLHKKIDSVQKESQTDDFRPTPPGTSTSPGLGHEEEEKYEALGAGRNSIDGATNDFRPTGPGHSPGVGHSLQVADKYEDNMSLHDSVTDGDKDDFRPTDPGHSPGAGHPRNFITGGGGGSKDDFRPTGPGRSPGVGHLVEQDKHAAIAGDKDDFRPTDPGHSPGIGHHALNPNKNGQP